MIWFFAMQCCAIGYGALYLGFSIRKRRFAQTAAVGVLIACAVLMLAVLLFEELSFPK